VESELQAATMPAPVIKANKTIRAVDIRLRPSLEPKSGKLPRVARPGLPRKRATRWERVKFTKTPQPDGHISVCALPINSVT